MTELRWKKSSYSGGGNGECVEVAAAAAEALVRDTKDRSGGSLRLTSDAWKAFLERI